MQIGLTVEQIDERVRNNLAVVEIENIEPDSVVVPAKVGDWNIRVLRSNDFNGVVIVALPTSRRSGDIWRKGKIEYLQEKGLDFKEADRLIHTMKGKPYSTETHVIDWCADNLYMPAGDIALIREAKQPRKVARNLGYRVEFNQERLEACLRIISENRSR